jgi:hypothetical protein
MKNTNLAGLTRVALRSAAVIAVFGAYGLMAQPTVKTWGGGASTTHFGYVDTNTLMSFFHTPMGMAVSQDAQTVFVADRDNNAVRLFTDFQLPNNGWTFTFTTNFISKPVGVALDSAGDVYVLNRGTTNNVATNGTVLEFDQYGYFVMTNAYGLTNAAGIVLDPFGNIYVTERSNLLVEITGGNNLNTVATVNLGTNVSLQGIALMPGGQIAACDSGRNGVYVITPSGNPTNVVITQIAGFNGQGDGTGINNEGLPTSRAKFFQPMGIAAASDGTLIVSDFGNGHVKVITTSGIVTNFYGVVSNDWKSAFPGWVDGKVGVPDQPGGVAGRCQDGVALSPNGTTIWTTEDFYHTVRQVTGQSFAPPVQPLPAAPVGVTASVVTNGNSISVIVSWDPVGNATQYAVERSTSPSGFSILGTTSGTSFTDTNVAAGSVYYYVVQAANSGGVSALSSPPVRVAIPVPPPISPSIGWYDFEPGFVNNIAGFYSTLHVVVPGVPFIVNNPMNLAIDPGVPGLQTYWATIPPATNNNTTANYIITNGLGAPPVFYSNQSPGSQNVNPLPVLQTSNGLVTVEAVNVNGQQTPSAVTSATFLFQVGPITLVGTNAAQFALVDITTNLTYVYTTDGSDPVTSPSAQQLTTTSNTTPFAININTNFTFQVFGERSGYASTPVLKYTFLGQNFQVTTISWGFTTGEASTALIGAAGETFYAPVTLSMLPGTSIYSLQFNMMVTNSGAGITNSGPPVAAGAFGFQSMLEKPIPGVSPPAYQKIPPLMFASYNTNNIPPQDIVVWDGLNFVNLTITNSAENLLAVGWLERRGETNLYNTLSQTLITYSQAHDDLFPNPGQPNGVIVGGYSFKIPANAAIGNQYQINIGSPSATDDGIGAPGSAVDIFAPNSTNSIWPGSLNAIKVVTVGSIPYLVGDVYNFRWFNAGDFGTGNLSAQGSADAEQAFETAAYFVNDPAPGSDFQDAMNSSGTFGVLDSNPSDQFYGFYTNAGPITPAQQASLFNANAASFALMDQMAFGHTNNPYDPDNDPEISDVYVTFVRSLDPGRTWFKRVWTNGVLVAQTTTNLATALKFAPAAAGAASLPVPVKNPALVSITNTPCVNFSSTDFLASAGQTLTIPINASIFGPYPMRMLMLNLSVVPLDGSPALTVPVTFTPNPALGTAFGSTTPFASDSHGNGNYSAAWMPSSSVMPYQLPGLIGNANIGNLTVTIPANATSSSAYAIHFDTASASPSGLLSFPRKTLTGLITLSNRSGSYYGDGIPDSWRLRYFGTIYNELSASNADADGTGMNNYQKYLAGLNPMDSTSVLNAGTDQAMAQSPQDHVVYWPSVSGQTYVIERSSTLFPPQWTPIATAVGDGSYMEIHDAPGGGNYFYRVSTQ